MFHAGIPDTPENRALVRKEYLKGYLLYRIEEGYRTLDALVTAPLNLEHIMLASNPPKKEELQEGIDFLVEKKELIVQEDGTYKTCLEIELQKA